MRAGSGLALDMEAVRVPYIRPFIGVLVDRVKKEVMYEPDVPWVVRVQVIVVFELEEESLPLPSEANGDVEP